MEKVLVVMKKVMKKVTHFLWECAFFIAVIAILLCLQNERDIKDAIGSVTRGMDNWRWALQPQPEIDTAWYTGNPSAESFEISTAAEMAGLAALVNRAESAVDFAGKTVRLAKDIDLSERYGATFNRRRGWVPIGDYAFVLNDSSYLYGRPNRYSSYSYLSRGDCYKEIHSHFFRGVFDGNGKVVRGLYINDSTGYKVGLFGQVAGGAEIRNLGVEGANVLGHRYVGAVAGYVDSAASVANCYSTGAVAGGKTLHIYERWSGREGAARDITSEHIGGVIGYAMGNVTNSYSTCAVSSKYGPYGTVAGNGGGVVGSVAGANANVVNCAALNPNTVDESPRRSPQRIFQGSVVGAADALSDSAHTVLSGNLAFRGSVDNDSKTRLDNIIDNIIGADKKGDAGITAIEINEDGTIGGLFTDTSVWTIQPGKLPGFGTPVDMPEHLSPNIPYIAKQPLGATVAIGEDGATHDLTVAVNAAEGGELSYQWYTYTSTSWRNANKTAIAGATGATFAAQIDTAGTRHYYAVVTNRFTDSLGAQQTEEVTSVAVTLRVLFFTNPDTAWYANNPDAASFEISTADELVGLAALVNRKDSAVNFLGKTIKLLNDIDLISSFGKGYTDGNGWIPIGIGSSWRGNSFCGVFDGNGKTISGVYINDGALENAGLFGWIGGCMEKRGEWGSTMKAGGVIKNLGVVNVNIKGGDNVGGIVGSVVHYSPDDSTSDVNPSIADSSNVANCYSTGVVVGNNHVGGILGELESRGGGLGGGVINSYSTASVSGSTTVGGVAGRILYATHITNCYSAGAVSGKTDIGGVVGDAVRAVRVINCAALNPSVKGTHKNVGRIVGENIDFNLFGLFGLGKGKLSDNMAFSGMTRATGKTAWRNRGANKKSGADITAAAINEGGTIGGLFADTSIWKTQPGKLPGLGAPVEMPEHLKTVSKGKKK